MADAADADDQGGRHVILGTFFIDTVIVHDVPRRTPGSTSEEIVFSEVGSEIDQELKNFFRERTIRSLEPAGLRGRA
jgi:hypothetical protein